MSKIAVVAVSGNAILRPKQRGLVSEQIRNADEAGRAILTILEHGYEAVLVHGNGPFLENVLTQVEESSNRVPPITLDLCVAQTQGSMAYMLEQAMLRQLQIRGITKQVAGVITQVVVNPEDPTFRNPSKTIGPFFNEYRAQELMRRSHYSMVEVPGIGYRRAVPTPRPLEIIPIDAIRRLVMDGYLVLAGGGGIPVARDVHGHLYGVEAVVDKDLAAGILATDLAADFLVILTDVERVYLNYGKPQQQPLEDISAEEAVAYLAEGHFPAENMGPKLQAAIDYIDRGGREVLITSIRKLPSALMGRTGTRIYHDGRRLDKIQLQKRLPFSQDEPLS